VASISRRDWLVVHILLHSWQVWSHKCTRTQDSPMVILSGTKVKPKCRICLLADKTHGSLSSSYRGCSQGTCTLIRTTWGVADHTLCMCHQRARCGPGQAAGEATGTGPDLCFVFTHVSTQKLLWRLAQEGKLEGQQQVRSCFINCGTS
jgi:hypothetical protein